MIATTTLPSGLRIVTEAMPGARSVNAGFWVGVGARDESPELAGASHFLEHLLFKGTEARSASSINRAVDVTGGDMNAFTTAEYTAFHARLPEGRLDLALDVLSDVVWAPAFRPADVEAERSVILEELLAEEDAPDDRVMTLLDEAVFPDHPLGAEVLGTRASVAAMDREAIRAFHARWYRPGNVVVAVAGAVDHDEVVAGIVGRLPEVGPAEAPVRRPPAAPPKPLMVLRRRSEQAHLAIAVRALARADEDRDALAVLNQVLGAGPSSRLFEHVREARGLAYTVYSATSAYSDAGALSVYAGTAPDQAAEVLALLHAELDRMVADGITEEELAVAAGYLEGSTLLGLEDSAGRMERIGWSLLLEGQVPSIDEVVGRFRSVTVADVARVIDRVLAGTPRSVAVVGPMSRRTLEATAA